MKEKKTKIAVVIDDDIVHLACVKRELMVLGYTVFLANDGSVALENLSNYGDVDLFVIDNHMPKTDGPVTIYRLRQNPFFSTVDIVGRCAEPDDMQEKTLKLLQENMLSTENLRFIAKPGRVFPIQRLSQKTTSTLLMVSAEVSASPEKSPSMRHSPIRKQSE